MAVVRGNLEEAIEAYGQTLAIVKKLAEGDPTNTPWQRDQVVCYWRLADLAERQKKDGEAQGYWKKAFEEPSGIEKRGLHLSPQDRQNMETLRLKAGADP